MPVLDLEVNNATVDQGHHYVANNSSGARVDFRGNELSVMHVHSIGTSSSMDLLNPTPLARNATFVGVVDVFLNESSGTRRDSLVDLRKTFL